jgi:reactive intermediate/imine deaminase
VRAIFHFPKPEEVDKPMRSTARLIAILCFGLLFTGGVSAQQGSKPKQPAQSADKSTPTAPLVEYLSADKSRPAPLSDAVRVGKMLYLSGQLGTDGASGLVSGGIKAETKQVMENIRRVLERNGSSLDQVVKCTVMLADISERSAMNEVYVTYFAKDRLPARSAFGVSGLVLGARVEIECVATIK